MSRHCISAIYPALAGMEHVAAERGSKGAWRGGGRCSYEVTISTDH